MTIDGFEYVAFLRRQVLDLAQAVGELCQEEISVPKHCSERAQTILAGPPDRPASFSTMPVGDSGDGVTAPLPAAKQGAPAGAKRPETRHLWPRTVVQPLSEPPARGVAQEVNAVIKAAGAAGIDIAGIVKQLAAKGVSFASDDEEKSVSNAVYGTLGPCGSIERVPGSGRPILWRAAQSDE